MTIFILRDREAGNIIAEFKTEKEAQEQLDLYEEEDKKEGNFIPNFYEVIESD